MPGTATSQSVRVSTAESKSKIPWFQIKLQGQDNTTKWSLSRLWWWWGYSYTGSHCTLFYTIEGISITKTKQLLKYLQKLLYQAITFTVLMLVITFLLCPHHYQHVTTTTATEFTTGTLLPSCSITDTGYQSVPTITMSRSPLCHLHSHNHHKFI